MAKLNETHWQQQQGNNSGENQNTGYTTMKISHFQEEEITNQPDRQAFCDVSGNQVVTTGDQEG